MNYFYDVENQCFLVEGIHTIPDTAISVSEEDYQAFIEGREKGQEIILLNDALTLTPPKPSPYHLFNGEEWVLNGDKLGEFITQRKEILMYQLSVKTDLLKNEILQGYPQAEIESFYRQEQEAHALKVNAEANAPMLREIAQSRGVALEILVEKVLEKAEQFAAVVGTVLGKKQKFEDEIAKAETFEQLEVIQEEVEKWFI